MSVKIFGFRPSPPDPRDFIYSKIVTTDNLPLSFSHPRIAIRDQGKFGTCVGQAAAAIKDHHERQNYPGRNYKFSPLFIYAECKKRDGIPHIEGTYPRTAMSVLKDIGSCKESTFPYSQLTDIKRLPTVEPKAYEEASMFRIGAYARIQTIEEIKAAIKRDGPVMVGVLVAENFVEPEKGGFVDLPHGYIVGAHAIAIDGWDDNKTHKYKDGTTRRGFFRFINSWGDDWGDGGYGWLPYDFVYYVTDIGMRFFVEAWSSVDIILPPKDVSKVVLWVGHNRALVDDEEVFLDQPPEIDPNTGRTLVPLRFLSEIQGWKVEWNSVEKKITLRK